MKPTHIYEVRPRKDKRSVDLISHALRFGRLWYDGPNAASNTVDYAEFYSRSHDAVIRVYDEAGNVIETHEKAAYLIEQFRIARAGINELAFRKICNVQSRWCLRSFIGVPILSE